MWTKSRGWLLAKTAALQPALGSSWALNECNHWTLSAKGMNSAFDKTRRSSKEYLHHHPKIFSMLADFCRWIQLRQSSCGNRGPLVSESFVAFSNGRRLCLTTAMCDIYYLHVLLCLWMVEDTFNVPFPTSTDFRRFNSTSSSWCQHV